jgi:hypothetical protein
MLYPDPFWTYIYNVILLSYTTDLNSYKNTGVAVV